MIARCDHVRKYFRSPGGHGTVKAVDGVSLAIEKGVSLGLVGESGSGKTTLGKIILGLIRPDSGTVDLRTDHPQVIFQDPLGSLDPKMRAGDIIAEGLVISGKHKPANIKDRVGRTLELVRLPGSAAQKYPHEFSGGEKQRIAIARAIITHPEFIICDEPVSSLDVTVQLEILRLLKDIRRSLGITYLFISHDLRVIRFMCEKVAVMKDGRIVEDGPTSRVYSYPCDPYTKLLVSSMLDVSR
jgi:peptide/nickel transport system ATP-binding protein